MNYVFSAGYKSLLFALYLKNILGKEIIIVTYSTDVEKYCKAEKLNYIFINQFRPRITSIFKLKAFKKILDDVIKKIDMNKEDIYIMTGIAIGYEQFYLAKEISKKGDVYNRMLMRELRIYKTSGLKQIFIRGILYKYIIKIVLGLDIMFYESNKDPRVGIDNDFMEKYNIRDYAPSLNTEEMVFEAVKKSKSNYKEYDNLIIDQGTLVNIIKPDSIKKLYKNLFELPLEFAFKKHPKSVTQITQSELSFYKTFKCCGELPNYIPVELFYNNIKKNVLSIFSASLITAAKLEHLKTISLLELVDWRHESYKKEWINHLKEESENKILFPKTFEELKELLLN